MPSRIQSDAISNSHKVSDRARNEKQKALFLFEAARLSRDRSSQAMANSNKLCEHAEKLSEKLSGKAHDRARKEQQK